MTLTLGDSLTQAALTAGGGHTRHHCDDGALRLAIRTEDGTQHFQRPADGGASDWRATDLHDPLGDFAFDEPVSPAWGKGLEALASGTPAPKGAS
ncbi:hypothetical protein [Streptomyces sp. NPDC058657]|uniref:hypothetical protein n=1 Tax=unclassified Streptomyces TaxID=2593676 RepID=UPI003655943E